MIADIALGKALVVPLTLAIILTLLLRRSANALCLLLAFFAGFFGAFSVNSSLLQNLPSALPSDQVGANTASQAWFSGFLEAAIPEEVAKGLWMLVFLVGWRQYSASHGALIGGLVALGFALRENLSFAQTAPEWRIMAGLSHGAWGVILGNLLENGLAGTKGRFKAVLFAFLPPVLLHGLLDTSIFLVEAYESQPETQSLPDPTQIPLRPVVLLEMLATFAAFTTSVAWAGGTVWSARNRGGPMNSLVDSPSRA